eukprot:Opistho-2@95846
MWAAYHLKRREVKLRAKTLINEEWETLCAEIDETRVSNPKRHWSLLRRLLPKSERRGAPIVRRIQNSAGVVVEDVGSTKAAWFEYFNRLGNPTVQEGEFDDEFKRFVEDELTKEYSPELSDDFKMLCEPIEDGKVHRALSAVQIGKAAGPDGVPNELLKAGGDFMVNLLRALFERSCKERKTPRAWKQGLIVPLHKKGDRTDPDNYRGITLLSCVGKLYNRVLQNRLAGALEDKLADEQGGFRQGQGCEDQLAIIMDVMHRRLNPSTSSRRRPISAPLHMAFLDLRKAYDTVWRDGLWYKLRTLGLPADIIAILQELYAECPNQVLVDGEVTDEFDIRAGLKQGDVLSPLLFNIFINDVVQAMKEGGIEGVQLTYSDAKEVQWASILLFADDVVLMSYSVGEINRALGIFSNFLRKWRGTLNVGKLKGMSICPTVVRDGDATVEYRGEPLEIVSKFPYLGVALTPNLDWTEAMSEAATHGRRQTGAIHGILTNKNLSMRTRQVVLQTRVRSGMEYGLELFRPTTQALAKLDSVQRMALCLIAGCNHKTSTTGILAEFGAPTFGERMIKRQSWFASKLKAMNPKRLTFIACNRPVCVAWKRVKTRRWSQASHSEGSRCRRTSLRFRRRFKLPATYAPRQTRSYAPQ